MVTVSKGDFGSDITRTLLQSDGVTPFNLATYITSFKVWTENYSDRPLLNMIASTVDAATGKVAYTISSGAFPVVGNYMASFTASDSTNGVVQSFEPFQLTVEEAP